MAIKTSRLVAEFDLKFNGLKTNFETELRREDVIFILNYAMREVFTKHAELAEVDTYNRNVLRKLEEKEFTLNIIEKKENYVVAEIPENSYKILGRKVLAYKEGCGEKIIVPNPVRTDSLNILLKNEYWKPDFAWENTLYDEGLTGLYVWSNNDFDIREVIIDYIKKPSELHAASLFEEKFYIDWNGKKITKDVDLEWDETFVFDEIINLAVLTADKIKGNVRDFQLNFQKK